MQVPLTNVNTYISMSGFTYLWQVSLKSDGFQYNRGRFWRPARVKFWQSKRYISYFVGTPSPESAVIVLGNLETLETSSGLEVPSTVQSSFRVTKSRLHCNSLLKLCYLYRYKNCWWNSCRIE